MKRLLKILKWIGIVVAGLLLAVLIFISPIAKYLIEKYDVKYIGREVHITQLGINLLTGTVNISGFRLYEADGKTVFIGFDHLNAEVELRPLFNGIYHLEHLTLDHPDVRVIQKGDSFNFDDILKKFSAPDTAGKPSNASDTATARYILDNIHISNGKFTYTNHDFNLDIQLQQLSLAVPQVAWNTNDLKVDYAFLLRSGGKFQGRLGIDLKSLAYVHDFRIDQFNLGVLKPYLDPYFKLSAFEGAFSIDVATRGNFNDPQAIAVHGKADISHLSIRDEKGEPAIGFGLFSVGIDSLNIARNIWAFNDILLDEPYFRFELFPEGNSLESLLIMDADSVSAASQDFAADSAGGSARYNPFVMLSDYVSTLAKQVIITDYRIRRFSITGGDINFFDHTLNEEFALDLKQFYVDVQQINPSKGRASADFSTTINKDGFIAAEITINPLDLLDFEVKYQLKNVAVVDYNPYSRFHIAYPFKTGKFNYEGTVTVKNHQIKMDNNLFVEKIYLGKKEKNRTAMDIPVKLALAILRDRDGNIRLVVPVEGDLDDPKIKVWPIVWQAIKNVLVKAALAPAQLFASAFGGNENDYKEIQFSFAQHDLTEKQIDKLSKLKTLLDEKPELILEMKQVVDTAKGIEYLAFQESRKLFYFKTIRNMPAPDTLAGEDLAAVDAIDNSDPAFLRFLANEVNNHDPLVSPLEKCFMLVGHDRIAAMQQARMERRNTRLHDYMITVLGIPENRLRIITSSDPADIPEDRIPRYLLSFVVEE